MKINHDNYESILIDYFDGILSDAERADVDLFLQENPEIAELFNDFEAITLSSDSTVYDRKEELFIIAKSNEEFEKIERELPKLQVPQIIYPHKHVISQSNEEFELWENDFPKLPVPQDIYPHKHKLLKLGKPQQRTQQWTWYAAAAACLAIAVGVYWQTMDTNEIDSMLLAEKMENRSEANEEWRMENEELLALDNSLLQDVILTRNEVKGKDLTTETNQKTTIP